MDEFTQVGHRVPFISQGEKKHNEVTYKRRAVTRDESRYLRCAVFVIFSILGIVVLITTCILLNYYVLTNAAVDVDILEAKKCPGCAGQSICPAFFRGDVSFSGIYRSRLAHLFHSASFGLDGTMGLYETARKVHLRRVGNPAPPEVVDDAVCRRGPQHGLPGASEVARAKLKCIPHLAIWRWRPTNDPVEGMNGDPVDLPLHRGLVAAPVFLPPQDGDPTLVEDNWASRVMPTAFSPATRCASDRLFRLLQSRFRERTSFGAETRWLRFDELMFLFNLAVDPQAVIWQTFPRTEGWPFPTYIGACGRWTVQNYHGVPLLRFCDSPLWLRLRLLLNIMDIPDRLERSDSTGSKNVMDAPEDSTSGYAIYLGNFDLPSLFTVDPQSYNVTVANLRHAIIVDIHAVSLYQNASTKEHVVNPNATVFLARGLGSHDCEGNIAKSGDAGGTTPPCMTRAHADELCSNVHSDHNIWAICATLLLSHEGTRPCSGFLHGLPSEFISTLQDCVHSLGPGYRRKMLVRAKDILLRTIQLHPEPKGW
ncbi:Divergent protein kinase domain 2A [Clonorchis sinensis]|uniref:Divergent protein kinase domain 2A n=1 Tax=Clonorchis sinensis TaxID=79923 RepID=A0A8T1MKQ3_CLOSI|nr:Divergent protein kinase domain 2A [Clonorchis sinensis]